MAFAPVDPSLESLPPSSRARQLYPEDLFENGQYVHLPMGRVRFWIIGPEDGVKVVLIHGLSIPSPSWRKIAPFLAESGFRVLIYDLYGKGYSQAPKTTYSTHLFTTQLALLLQYVQWTKAHIVGFSMGGGIAVAFAVAFPHLVAGKLVFIASAGLRESAPDVGGEGPVVSPTHMAVFAELRKLQEEQLPGYKGALVSCLRDGPVWGLSSAFDAVANDPSDVAVLVIHGTKDATVPYTVAHKILAHIPRAELLSVEDATHELTIAEGHWQLVAQALANFLA